jgi:hypothetical protein
VLKFQWEFLVGFQNSLNLGCGSEQGSSNSWDYIWLWCFSKEVQFQFGCEIGEWIDEEPLTMAIGHLRNALIWGAMDVGCTGSATRHHKHAGPTNR